MLSIAKKYSDFKLLKIDKIINKINGINICICLNEIVVRADIHDFKIVLDNAQTQHIYICNCHQLGQ